MVANFFYKSAIVYCFPYDAKSYDYHWAVVLPDRNGVEWIVEQQGYRGCVAAWPYVKEGEFISDVFSRGSWVERGHLPNRPGEVAKNKHFYSCYFKFRCKVSGDTTYDDPILVNNDIAQNPNISK